MKRHRSVYLATVILGMHVIGAFYISATVQHKPGHLLIGWLIDLLLLSIVSLLYWKPRIGRWIAGPWLILMGLGGISSLEDGLSALALLIQPILILLYVGAGAWLLQAPSTDLIPNETAKAQDLVQAKGSSFPSWFV